MNRISTTPNRNSSQKQPCLKGGFTLIELLGVIAFIAILAGIAFARVEQGQGKGAVHQVREQRQTTGVGLASVHPHDNDTMPPNIESPDTGGMFKSLPRRQIHGPQPA